MALRWSIGGTSDRECGVRINTLTAQPVLRYLLAEAGFEPPMVPVREGWDVFQKYLALPAESAQDVAGFQSSWIRENPEQPVFSIVLCRQLTDDKSAMSTRTIALNFLFEDPKWDLDEQEYWSTDFRSLDAFLDHVDRLRQMEFALQATPTLGDVVEQEE